MSWPTCSRKLPLIDGPLRKVRPLPGNSSVLALQTSFVCEARRYRVKLRYLTGRQVITHPPHWKKLKVHLFRIFVVHSVSDNFRGYEKPRSISFYSSGPQLFCTLDPLCPWLSVSLADLLHSIGVEPSGPGVTTILSRGNYEAGAPGSERQRSVRLVSLVACPRAKRNTIWYPTPCLYLLAYVVGIGAPRLGY